MRNREERFCAECPGVWPPRPPVFSPASGGRQPASGRAGLILVVVLVMVVLLALLAAGFTFSVRASANAVYARHHEFQARMAAEAGVQRAIVVLRTDRANPDRWYDNPEVFRQAPVEIVTGSQTFQQYDTAREQQRARDDEDAEPVWRYTLYGVNSDDPEQAAVRYGITPETSKVDLNTADEEQLARLLDAALTEDKTPDQQPIDREALLHSLLDWKEAGDSPRPKGAKDDYYLSLRPPYRCKRGRLDTVEELLMIKGFTAWVVFGEDYNRNGLLDPNEDDGDASFPPDNADGELFRGLAPFVTVWSREVNIDSTNLPRVNLNLRDIDELEKQLSERGIDAGIMDYIIRIRTGGKSFRSVMDLLPVPPVEDQEAELAPEADQQEEEEVEQKDQLEEEEKEEEGEDEEGATTQPTSGPASQPASEDGKRKDERSSTTRPSKPKQEILTNLTDEIPPGTPADLPVLLDRLTTDPLPLFVGRINVNTAPREVLRSIGEFTTEEVEAIVSGRAGLSGDDRKTPGWLLTEGIISELKFRRVLRRLTTGSSTFTVESVGFADHVGVIKRLNTVLEMRGPIGQVLYYRDLTPLGPAYTPHGEERRGFGNRAGR